MSNKKNQNPVKNPKIGVHMANMFNKWWAEQFPSRVTKAEPDPNSITQTKIRTGLPRCAIRKDRGL